MEPLHEHSQRRNSFRRSLNECGLSPEYLEQLEAKRKALDDSIHRFIASKEREYQAYEKELRHQARRSDERLHNAQTDTASTAIVDTVVRSNPSKKVHDHTSEIDFGVHNGLTDAQRQKEDFQGVFTPEYLAALDHPSLERTASAPASTEAPTGSPNTPMLRTSSDSATRPARLTKRMSSSGSSADGRLVSALKSTTETTRTPPPPVQQDVGDMFDLEEDEVNASYQDMPDSSLEDYFDNDMVNSTDRTASQQSLDMDRGEPPPDDLVHSEPLIFAEGAAATKQPASPGFRRPSAAMDPVYTGRGYRTAENEAEQSSFYGSSYSRDGKGSFTSSSLGESYMAKNAEKLMALRGQHETDRQASQAMQVR
ncbi:hypothetical protein AMS68_005839 [Peltaster fructicola]|uniref:Uncharacterized protein n=1 Tax=Peltaster fructicola TaxID=286661 RepID=A0A6H0XZW8_9PEZI|nr:hypothetical protein AMS68_005839 [Peltaster fructicola]